MAIDVYVKKYFWVVGVLVAVVCSALAARAVSHIVEATALADSDRPSHRAVPIAAPPPAAAQGPSKSGEALAERNMFCSACQPENPNPAPEPGTPTDGNSPPMTSLPLRLVATNVAERDKYSFATVLNTQSNVQGAYWIGDAIPAAGPVVHVYGKFVDFKNTSAGGRVERMSLLAQGPAPTSHSAPPPPTASHVHNRNSFLAAVDQGVRKVGDDSYEVDRSLVNKFLANPTQAAHGARIVPSVKNGQPNGFRLYAIRPNSVYAKIGFMNGDTVHAINGFELNSMDKALEVYTKVKEANSLAVSITRRGKPVTLNYSIK